MDPTAHRTAATVLATLAIQLVVAAVILGVLGVRDLAFGLATVSLLVICAAVETRRELIAAER